MISKFFDCHISEISIRYTISEIIAEKGVLSPQDFFKGTKGTPIFSYFRKTFANIVFLELAGFGLK